MHALIYMMVHVHVIGGHGVGKRQRLHIGHEGILKDANLTIVETMPVQRTRIVVHLHSRDRRILFQVVRIHNGGQQRHDHIQTAHHCAIHDFKVLHVFCTRNKATLNKTVVLDYHCHVIFDGIHVDGATSVYRGQKLSRLLKQLKCIFFFLRDDNIDVDLHIGNGVYGHSCRALEENWFVGKQVQLSRLRVERCDVNENCHENVPQSTLAQRVIPFVTYGGGLRKEMQKLVGGRHEWFSTTRFLFFGLVCIVLVRFFVSITTHTHTHMSSTRRLVAESLGRSCHSDLTTFFVDCANSEHPNLASQLRTIGIELHARLKEYSEDHNAYEEYVRTTVLVHSLRRTFYFVQPLNNFLLKIHGVEQLTAAENVYPFLVTLLEMNAPGDRIACSLLSALESVLLTTPYIKDACAFLRHLAQNVEARPLFCSSRLVHTLSCRFNETQCVSDMLGMAIVAEMYADILLVYPLNL